MSTRTEADKTLKHVMQFHSFGCFDTTSKFIAVKSFHFAAMTSSRHLTEDLGTDAARFLKINWTIGSFSKVDPVGIVAKLYVAMQCAVHARSNNSRTLSISIDDGDCSCIYDAFSHCVSYYEASLAGV